MPKLIRTLVLLFLARYMAFALAAFAPCALAQELYAEERISAISARIPALENARQTQRALDVRRIAAEMERVASEDLSAFPEERALVLCYLASILSSINDHAGADELLTAASEAVEGEHDTFPAAAVAVLFTRFAQTSQSRPAAARAALDAAVRLIESKFSRESLFVANMLDGASFGYRQLGEIAEATRLQRLGDETRSKAQAAWSDARYPVVGTPYPPWIAPYFEERRAFLRGMYGVLWEAMRLNSKRQDSILADIEDFVDQEFRLFPREYAQQLSRLANTHLQFGRYQEAERLNLSAANVLAKHERGFKEARLMVALVDAHNLIRRGDFAGAAIQSSLAADVISDTFSDPSAHKALYLSAVAGYLERARRADVALTLRRKAREVLAQTIGTASPTYVNALHELAFTEMSNANFAEAESVCFEALKIIPNLRLSPIVLPGPGRTPRPEELRTLAPNSHEKERLTLRIYNILSHLYRASNQLEKLEALQEKEIRLARSTFGPTSDLHLTALWNRAIFSFDNGSREVTAGHYRQLQELLRSHDMIEHDLYQSAELALVTLSIENRDWVAAEPKLRLALRQAVNEDRASAIRIKLIQLLVRSGRYREAVEQSRILDSWIQAQLNRDTMLTLVADYSRTESMGVVLADYSSILLELAATSGADRLRLTSRAFEIAQLVREANDTSVGVAALAVRRALMDESDLVNDLRELQDSRRLIKSMEADLTHALGNTSSSNPLRSELQRERNKSHALRRKLLEDPRVREALKSQAPVDVEKVQQYLRNDQALVFYVLSFDSKLVFVITKDDVNARALCSSETVCSDPQVLDEHLVAFRRLVAPGSARGVRRVDSDAWDHNAAMRHGSALYEALWRPIEDELQSSASRIQHAVIVPDRRLVSLPFAALVSESDALASDSPRWLAEDIAVSYLPSVRAVKTLGATDETQLQWSRFVGFGDPLYSGSDAPSAERVATVIRGAGDDQTASFTRLPETYEEICRIAALFTGGSQDNWGAECAELEKSGDGPVQVYLREDATEENLREVGRRGDLEGLDLLAFATHGVVSGAGFAESGLLLTPGTSTNSQSDGFLSATEIVPLRIDARLVLLSACSTASAYSSDLTLAFRELPSLVSTFFHAGAESVLATSTDVYSEAATRITTGMLTRLKDGTTTSKAIALNHTIKGLIAQESKLPSYWAPFAYYGMN